MKNLVPLALLIGGVVAALCYVYLAFTQPEREVVVQFAIACICAVIGWKELIATDGVFEAEQGE